MDEIKLRKKHMGKNKVKRKIEKNDSILKSYYMGEVKRHKKKRKSATENKND